MTQGLSFEAFAGHLSVCRQTIYNWRKQVKDFDDAYNIAIDASRLFWEKKGLEALHDRSINPTIWIFTMKCRFREEWGDKLPEIKTNEEFDSEALRVLAEYAKKRMEK